MKYVDKLNLKSSIYKYDKTQRSKSNTPRKSGNKSQNKSMIKQPLKPIINPNDLFQKVCCPNCKYSFKIIKNEVLKQIKSNDKSVSKSVCNNMNNNKIIKKSNKDVQTQSKYTFSFDDINNNKQSYYMRYSGNSTYLSPNKYHHKYLDNSLNDIQNYKHSQLFRLNYMLNTQQKYLNNSQYKFKPLSVSQTNIKNNFKNNNNNNNQQLLNTLNNIERPIQKKEYQKKVQIYREYENNHSYQNEEQDQGQFQYKQFNQTYNVNKNNKNNTNTNISNKFNDNIHNQNHQQQNFNHHHNNYNKQKQKIYCDQCGKHITNKNNLSSSKLKSNLRYNNNNNNNNNTINNNNNNNNDYDQISKNNNPSNNFQPSQTKLLLQQSNKLFQLLLCNQQTQNSYNQIISVCKILSEQVQLPSFCKMLAYTIHNVNNNVNNNNSNNNVNNNNEQGKVN